MAKQPSFPMTIMAGSTAIKIYFSPLSAPDSPTAKSYDSYVVSYYSGGKRVRCRFNSLTEAKDKANAVKTSLLNDDATALQITGEDSLIYARAKNIVSHLGIPLDQMAREYADAREKLGSVSLQESVLFYERFGKTVKEVKSVPKIVEELNTSLTADGKSEYHRRDMKRRLEAFALAFPKSIMALTTKEITEWLRSLKFTNSEGHEVTIAPKTRNHYRNSVVQLFNFAKDHGYLPKGMPTEAEAVKTVEVTPPVNQIFKVEEIEKLLRNAPAHLVVPIAIKAFCGIRTEEMVNLCWEHIHWDNQHIILPAAVTKTKLRRLIPLSPNLVPWISSQKKEAGRICERWQDAQTMTQAFDRYGKSQGIDVGANKFRNSYISYRVAVTHDVAKVALESGNSPRIIQREYLELATEEDGKRWFSVMPQPPKAKTKAAKQKRK